MINNFNSTIIEALRCNVDIKFIGSGASAKAISFYITDYIAKHQLKAHIAYSLLELAIKKMDEQNICDDDLKKRGKQLLQKCAHALISQQELSSQQVISYLLDFEDHFTSHSFSPLYWSTFETLVNRQDPCPECYTHPLSQCTGSSSELSIPDVAQTLHLNTNESGNHTSSDFDDDNVRISVDENKLVINSSQQADYIFRNSSLDALSLWDFIAQTEKVKGDPAHCKVPYYNHDVLFSTNKVRPSFPFSNEHEQHSTHVLRIKHPSHRCVPTLVGSPPHIDHEEQCQKYS